jgi:hypothetical protein
MRRARLLVVAALLAVAMLAISAMPASAEWIDHPYPGVGYWWCDWYYDGGIYEGYTYWCQDEGGNWLRTSPTFPAGSLADLEAAGIPAYT